MSAAGARRGGPEELRASPDPLHADYGRFRAGERLLLSGHSHQAWPDVALEGMVECFEDAALCVDDKWGRAFAKADELRAGVAALAGACAARGAELLVDVYHLAGPRRVALGAMGLEAAWVVGGGYKYLQLGEGNCFLLLPPLAAGMRPAITGWFAEFDALAAAPDPDGRVAYGAGASRFAGATYDPTSC